MSTHITIRINWKSMNIMIVMFLYCIHFYTFINSVIPIFTNNINLIFVHIHITLAIQIGLNTIIVIVICHSEYRLKRSILKNTKTWALLRIGQLRWDRVHCDTRGHRGHHTRSRTVRTAKLVDAKVVPANGREVRNSFGDFVGCLDPEPTPSRSCSADPGFPPPGR